MLVVGGSLAIFPAGLLHFVAGQEVMLSSTFHFWAVGASALLATLAGFSLSYAGWRKRDPRAVLVGTAFSVMAALLVVHGFASPGVVVSNNGVVAFTGAATLPVGGAILALSALPVFREPRGVAWLLRLQGALMVGVVALGGIALLLPTLVPSVPEAGGAAAMSLLVVGLLCYGFLGLRTLRTVLLARRRADVLVLAGLVWLAAALVPALTQTYLDLGWWLGHAFEVAGVILVGIPVAADLYRATPSRPLAGDLRGADLMSQEEAFLGSHVRALTRLLAEKDEYTEGHTRRVALLAVQVGEQLGFAPGKLRELAIGGLLHDIGKLSVPDAILKKPGPLEPQEYEIVCRHPVWGDTLLRELGFSPRVRRLVRDHHERLDGSGYPNGVASGLPLETRVLAVCDVYDALCSTRVYRDAWSHERALRLLKDESGGAFDLRCVEALETVLKGRQQGAALTVAIAV